MANSDVILIATSGPFWMWCLASRAGLLSKFSNMVMEDLLDDAKAEYDKDNTEEEFDAFGDDDDSLEGSYTPILTALFDAILPQKVFTRDPALPWSEVVMLNNKESEIELHFIMKARMRTNTLFSRSLTWELYDVNMSKEEQPYVVKLASPLPPPSGFGCSHVVVLGKSSVVQRIRIQFENRKPQ